MRFFSHQVFIAIGRRMYRVDITIIGAGIVGLSIARQLIGQGKDIVVVEKEPGPGRGISSRNSEVIHAGIYYPPGSLKSALCVRGAAMLYDFCAEHHVPCKRTGKVIVAASDSEEASIEELFLTAKENGATGLRMLDKKELAQVEPHVCGHSALYSPNTGIIDSHQLTKRMEALCLSGGVTILYRSVLIKIEKDTQGFICTVEPPGHSPYSFSTRILINAAGLESQTVAAMAGVDTDQARYRIFPVKGEYFRVRGGKQGLVNGLVYPSPEKNLTGLGIHATKDLSGSLRLGPNAFYVDRIEFDVDQDHACAFFESTHDLLPFLREEDLMPDMAGIRPKLQSPGGAFRDFVISHEADRGLYGLITLVGIESPGLTSCLAIGDHVKKILREAALL